MCDLDSSLHCIAFFSSKKSFEKKLWNGDYIGMMLMIVQLTSNYAIGNFMAFSERRKCTERP